MALFKCKMCGGTLEINNNESIVTCEYCGTQQTLPKLYDDRRANLYDRANHFRRNNEFDKAMGIYEQILTDDNTDSEAYWSLVLCRYGIEYVEDPSTRKRIPTVNRAQYTSVFDDDNYRSALQYAEPSQRKIYEREANAINEIQKGILSISQKEEPFDVFICYKETDNNGRRTPDSVLANELYHELRKEGYKVFFSRITLEDKLGTAYEPYIFAALNSAKIMVVLGTKPEYFNAVWVKNEWSRFLSLIKQGQKKMLIPAYKDMDPYDLPEEFSHLQAQDMSKLGFMQDLIRGIQKIIQAYKPKTAAVKESAVPVSNMNTEPLLKRAFMFLEDGDWASADEYCEKVLDINPENASAYLGKLMAELHVEKQEGLKDQPLPFDDSNNYQKTIRFADDKLKTTLAGYIEYINIRNENERISEIYSRARDAMSAANTEEEYIKAAQLFESLGDYEDSLQLASDCREKAEAARKDAILYEAKFKMDGNSLVNYESASKLLASIPGWKEADELAKQCREKEQEIKAKRLAREHQEELDRKKAQRIAKRNRIIAVITLLVICAVIPIAFTLKDVIKYNEALDLMAAGKLDEAESIFKELGSYKDSADKIEDIESARREGNLSELKDSVEELEVGDHIEFGMYKQDADSDKEEFIEWLVLAKKGNSLLIVSKYALDCQPYNEDDESVTWETSDIRAWLNDEFYNTAFSEGEMEIIETTTVVNDDNPNYGTEGGNDTRDKVFLLSIDEAESYFSSDEARECEPTTYAEKQGAYVNSSTGNCRWWLRSPGYSADVAAIVDTGGGVSYDGNGVFHSSSAVRPALWINLES